MAKYIDDVQIMHFDLVLVSSKGSSTSLYCTVRLYSMVRAEEEHDYSTHLIIGQPRKLHYTRKHLIAYQLSQKIIEQLWAKAKRKMSWQNFTHFQAPDSIQNFGCI